MLRKGWNGDGEAREIQRFFLSFLRCFAHPTIGMIHIL